MSSNFTKHKREFEIFCAELLLWGETHNITGYKSKKDIMQNIITSIAPLEFISDFKSCLDIGSGCGFPAIPLAICKENSEFFLVEPQIKRVSFLNIIAINLGLKNITILKNRIELVEKLPKIDLITSRAFDKSKNIISISSRFLDENGHFLFYKSKSEFENGNTLESKGDLKNVKISLKNATKSTAKKSKIFYFYQNKREALQWQESYC